MSGTFTRRSIAFLLATILALVAAVSIVSYLRSLETAAAEENQEVIGYVATGQIEAGTLIDSAIQQGLVEERPVPKALVAPGAITDLTQVRGRLVNTTILPGDQLVAGRFAAPGEGVQALAIPEGHHAISVEVGVPPGVANYVQKGDHVSVIGLLTVPTEDEDETTTTLDTESGTTVTQRATEERSQFVLHDLEVLAIGQRRVTPATEEGEEPAQSVASILTTFAVTPDEAERLVYASQTGTIWFTLLPEDETEPVQTGGRTADNIFEE